MLIKAGFSRWMLTGERRNQSRMRKGERGIWQRRYWEHLSWDERDFARPVDYLHYNPAKHSYVTQVGEWAYSTFHRYVKTGVYPKNWAGTEDDLDEAGYGE
jgi:putative transposase